MFLFREIGILVFILVLLGAAGLKRALFAWFMLVLIVLGTLLFWDFTWSTDASMYYK